MTLASRLLNVAVLALIIAAFPASAVAADFTNTREGFQFSIPEGWVPDTPPEASFADIASTATAVQGRGVLSPGTATIGVYPMNGTDTPDSLWAFMKSSPAGDVNTPTETRDATGALTRVDYVQEHAEDGSYRSTELFRRIGGRWFHVSLRYHDGDPRSFSYEQALTSVADSLSPRSN